MHRKEPIKYKYKTIVYSISYNNEIQITRATHNINIGLLCIQTVSIENRGIGDQSNRIQNARTHNVNHKYNKMISLSNNYEVL